MANIGYDQQHNYYWCVPCDYVPVSYPGTGDIFAAVLTASFPDRGQFAHRHEPCVPVRGNRHQKPPFLMGETPVSA